MLRVNEAQPEALFLYSMSRTTNTKARVRSRRCSSSSSLPGRCGGRSRISAPSGCRCTSAAPSGLVVRNVVSAVAVPCGEDPPERPQTRALAPAASQAVTPDRACAFQRAAQEREHEVGSTDAEQHTLHDRSVRPRGWHRYTSIGPASRALTCIRPAARRQHARAARRRLGAEHRGRAPCRCRRAHPRRPSRPARHGADAAALAAPTGRCDRPGVRCPLSRRPAARRS